MHVEGKDTGLRVAGLGAGLEITPLRFGLMLAGLLSLWHPGILLGTTTFFYRDYGVLGYPFIHFHRECFWAGELPLWNPLSNCGAPFLAQWGTMTLYPPSLFYLLFPLPWSLGVFCLAHLWLGGLGMFQLARRWMGAGPGPALAGVAFALGGVAQSSLMWPNYTVALGWMPWVVLLVERALERNRSAELLLGPAMGDLRAEQELGAPSALFKDTKRGLFRGVLTPHPVRGEGCRLAAMAAFVGALQMLSGVPEIILMTWLVVGGIVAGRLVASYGFRVSDWWPVAGRFSVIVALVAGLAAAQLLPFFELLEHSQRQGGVEARKWAMPLWGWANLFLPAFHYFRTFQGTFMQEGQSFFTTYYPGATVMALAGLAVWRVRRRKVWFLAAVTLAGLVLAWGDAFPPNRWLRELIPLAGFARYPVKFVVLAAFALPLLAGFAVQWVAGVAVSRAEAATGNSTAPQPPPPAPHRRSGLGRGSDDGALFALPAVFGAALVVVLGLWFVAWRFPFEYDQQELTGWSVVVRIAMLGTVAVFGLACLRSGRPSERIGAPIMVMLAVVIDLLFILPKLNPTLPADVMTPGLGVAEAKFDPVPALGRGRVFITPAAEERLLRSDVPDLGQDFIGKRLALWSNLNVLDGVPKVNGSSTLRVREENDVQEWLYASETNAPPRLLDFLGVTHVSSPASAVEWVARPNARPWVTAGQRPVFADEEATRRVMTSADFAPDELVCLPPEAKGAVTVGEGVAVQLDLGRFDAQAVELQVNAPQPTVVVIAQSWYPAWRAYVDGQPVRLWRANHAFQAFEVPAGRHTVLVRYEDRRFQAGAVISLASFLICAGMVWAGGQRSTRHHGR